MSWRVTADVEEFDEAIDWFAARTPVTDAERKSIPAQARSAAFWIAGAAQLDVVQSVQNDLADAIKRGTTVEDFKKLVRERLLSQWGKDNPARVELIFRNATQQAYNAGRYAQMTDPAVARFRPFWLYDAIMDGKTSKICSACNGVTLPMSDAWWDTHSPQQHHACRCSIRSLRTSEAEKRGLTPQPPTIQAAPGFGLSPRLQVPWQPNPATRSPQLMQQLEHKRAEFALRPEIPALPKTFDKTPHPARAVPALEHELPVGHGKSVALSKDQQKAQQLARELRESFGVRSEASVEDRKTWLLWEWVRGSKRKTSMLVGEAARREFDLTGVPRAGGKVHTFQGADLTRTQRDLRAVYDQTQAWYKRRGIRAVTLYRASSADGDDVRNAVESWTSDKGVADAFARSLHNGYVMKVTVPVGQVLTHYQVSEWVDGPLGPAKEHLVLW